MIDVIVTGGRDYDDAETVAKILNLFDIGLLIHGDCSGADKLADTWAKAYNVPRFPMPANWYVNGKLDRSQGPKRNIRMLEAYPNAVVIAFPGGKGTKNCMEEALARGHRVLEVK